MLATMSVSEVLQKAVKGGGISLSVFLLMVPPALLGLQLLEPMQECGGRTH